MPACSRFSAAADGGDLRPFGLAATLMFHHHRGASRPTVLGIASPRSGRHGRPQQIERERQDNRDSSDGLIVQ
jgi:hypothetical protein